MPQPLQAQVPPQQYISYAGPILGSDLDRLLPPKGAFIPRQEWPSGPQDKKSIAMSLHQAGFRSPRRVVAEPDRGSLPERHYQAIMSLPLSPKRIPPTNYLYKFDFPVNSAEFALQPKPQRLPENASPVAEHLNGTLRWRLRCCRLKASKESAVSEHDWAVAEVSWPAHISVKMNNHVIEIRRHTHNGKDLPAELTPYVVPGMNHLHIAVASMTKPSSNREYFVAVELVETLSHSHILDYVWKHGFIGEQKTLSVIKSRLKGTSDEDDGLSLAVQDLSIDLADPFSSAIFKIPARGAECSHMECFDLETWLNTRPAKAIVGCRHGRTPCPCASRPEPSNPDKWKCPICSKDARPYSLHIDGFLLSVRQKLESEGKLHAKSMFVSPDGSWKPVLEDPADDTSDDEDVGIKRTSVDRVAKSGSIPTGTGRPNVEVIELDDD